MADEVEIKAPAGWLTASPAADLLGLFGVSLLTTPDVYTSTKTTSGSDYIVIAVVAIIVLVLLIGVWMARTSGKVRS